MAHRRRRRFQALPDLLLLLWFVAVVACCCCLFCGPSVHVPPPSNPSLSRMSYYSRSPPPLQHPVPTHPAYIPDPPTTPVSPQGYQRFSGSSSPAPVPVPAYSVPAYSVPAYSSPVPTAWGMNDVTAQFGMQLGHSAVAAGQDYVQRNVSPPSNPFASCYPTPLLAANLPRPSSAASFHPTT